MAGSSKESDDPQDQNPTGLKRKASARTRRKKDRRLFRGTPWDSNRKGN